MTGIEVFCFILFKIRLLKKKIPVYNIKIVLNINILNIDEKDNCLYVI